MTAGINLDNIHIVLKTPRFPENIGAAARAMRNMGIRRLVVIAPENFDIVRVMKMATHAASDVVKSIESHETIEDALARFNYVVGTTARVGARRKIVGSPRRLAERLVPISRENKIAVLFGPEDRGLTNEDIRLCHELVNIPTAEFSSLNLAQSVMVMCHELYGATREEKDEFSPRLAERHELEGMYAQLKDILVKINYVNPENPEYWLNNLRHFFTRLGLRAKEVRIIRGICRQINWYAEKRYRDGLAETAGKEDGK